MEHPDMRVQAAITELNEAIVNWNRSTEIATAVIIRDTTKFEHRTLDGLPISEDPPITDTQLMMPILAGRL